MTVKKNNKKISRAEYKSEREVKRNLDEKMICIIFYHLPKDINSLTFLRRIIRINSFV